MRGMYILFLCIGLTALDLLVPYLLLARLPSFLATFLFWCLLTLAAIAFGIVATRRWGRGA